MKINLMHRNLARIHKIHGFVEITFPIERKIYLTSTNENNNHLPTNYIKS